MSTHVYAISSSEQPAPVKIGRTANVLRRLSQLQTASPIPLRVWWQRETPDPELERKLHQLFASQRISGEWFRFQGPGWVAEIAHAAELLEGDHHVEEGSLVGGHGHRPHDGSAEWSRESAGEGARCSCGHTAAAHVGPAPYACTGVIPEWNCSFDCECPEFRSDVPWSPNHWLRAASDCPRCGVQQR
ncbi:GIY-YIG nuclease family protein [Streptomyces sp. NPDC006863]|uniref:GIY-YIG nuclease family protein n=1 Tax=Streptomyces sp. NPDC006863 TaxID=3154779 RepID=UPI0033F371BB